MGSKISLCLFIIASLLLSNTMIWADGKWEIARDDDFLRNDGLEGDLKDTFFIDENNGWVVGGNLILKTSDGGKTWEIQTTGAETPPTFWSVYFRDAKSGVIAGTGTGRAPAGGRPGRGGAGERTRPPGPPGDGERPGPGQGGPGRGGGTRPPGEGGGPPPGFAPPGFRRGGGTAVYKTEDGGKTWVQQRVDTRSQLSDIQMVDENIGYAVGASNAMVKTTDAGATWNPIMRGQRARTGETRNYLDGLYFVTPEIGWIVGSFGKIMHTTDGGENWEEQKVDRPTDLKSVHFVTEKDGWVVGNEGAILHTVDGGKTWEQQKSNTDDSLRSVVFLDKNIGWACGDFGTVVHTTDGGKTWKRENTGTSTNLFRISAFKTENGSNYCWAVGEWGLIIRYVPNK